MFADDCKLIGFIKSIDDAYLLKKIYTQWLVGAQLTKLTEIYLNRILFDSTEV